jgi:hypothetical protein
VHEIQEKGVKAALQLNVGDITSFEHFASSFRKPLRASGSVKPLIIY